MDENPLMQKELELNADCQEHSPRFYAFTFQTLEPVKFASSCFTLADGSGHPPTSNSYSSISALICAGLNTTI